MKTLVLSPQPIKIKPLSMENKSPQTKDDRESNYFPGCRKDANCNCTICLESITATLDLLPMSVQRSTLTKLSVSKPKPSVDVTPVSIDPTLLSTPISKSPPVVEELFCSSSSSSSSSLKSTVQSTPNVDCKKTAAVKKRNYGGVFKFLKWVLIFGVMLGLEFGFSWVIPRVLRPKLSREIVRDVMVKESFSVKSLSERLELVQKGLNVSVDGKLSSCLLGDSTWKINQDGLILLSYCTLYQSLAEEVIVWGWPLQTSGLLTSEFSSRSFNVMAGRITEWHEGNIIHVVRNANTTWFLKKWSSSIVQFEPNTWMIEYKRSSLLENQGIILLGVKLTKFRISNFMQRLQQRFWFMLELIYEKASMSEVAGSSSIPT